jgi:hypothetical protein
MMPNATGDIDYYFFTDSPTITYPSAEDARKAHSEARNRCQPRQQCDVPEVRRLAHFGIHKATEQKEPAKARKKSVGAKNTGAAKKKVKASAPAKQVVNASGPARYSSRKTVRHGRSS